MVYKDLGHMRCSTGGGRAFDLAYSASNHYVCFPPEDGLSIFERTKLCETKSLRLSGVNQAVNDVTAAISLALRAKDLSRLSQVVSGEYSACMVHDLDAKLYCSHAGGETMVQSFERSDYYICLPQQDAATVLERLALCETG